jgi:hypothetical protein
MAGVGFCRSRPCRTRPVPILEGMRDRPPPDTGCPPGCPHTADHVTVMHLLRRDITATDADIGAALGWALPRVAAATEVMRERRIIARSAAAAWALTARGHKIAAGLYVDRDGIVHTDGVPDLIPPP